MNTVRLTLAALLTLAVTTLAGCFSSNPKDIEAFMKPRQTDVTAENYILEPPDVVEVQCTKAPEIDTKKQQIRPDGKISFEGVGEVQAAGKTPAQLAEVLKEKISALYKLAGDKPLDVRLNIFRSKKYYVLGQVYIPGPKEYTGRDTVLYAVSYAQPNQMAWLSRVQVIRPSDDLSVKPKIFEVNFKEMAGRGDLSKNVLLQEGDIVYVPPTILSSIAMVVEEFVRPIGRAFATVNIVSGTTTGYGGAY